MKRTRTPTPPLFDLGSRPLSNRWNWLVTLDVASSGYVTGCHVTASTGPQDDRIYGTAFCAVSMGDDVMEVIECLAIESMLATTEQQLDGNIPRREIEFVSTRL